LQKLIAASAVIEHHT